MLLINKNEKNQKKKKRRGYVALRESRLYRRLKMQTKRIQMMTN